MAGGAICNFKDARNVIPTMVDNGLKPERVIEMTSTNQRLQLGLLMGKYSATMYAVTSRIFEELIMSQQADGCMFC